MLVKIENRQLAHILVLFLITQFAGLLLASLIFSTTTLTEISGGTSINSTDQTLYYFGTIILFALLLLFVIKKFKGDLIFKIIEAFAVVSTSFFFFLIILGYLFPSADALLVTIIAFVLALALIVAKNKKPSIKNIVVVISSVGLGVVLGISFGFSAAFLFMILIAIYDYVAVFITKHMVTFANALSGRNLAFLITASDIEVSSQADAKRIEGKDFAKHLQEMKKIDNPVIKKLIAQGKIPMIAQVQLGAGDLGLPLMLAVSAYPVFGSYFLSIAIVVGGALGLIATMLFLRKYRRPLPAIPPIFAVISIFIGLALPFTKASSLYLSGLLIGFGMFILYIVMFLTLKMGENKTK